MRLNRNFIAISSVEQYYETIKNKIVHEPLINEKNVLELFKILINYEKNDNEYYNKIMKKLGEYTEGFVLINSLYISKLLKLSEEERKIIMIEFDNLNYSDDLNILDFIKHIQDVFVLRITSFVKSLIENSDYDKEEFTQIVLDIKNNKNEHFRVQIMDEVLQIFPSINKEPIFSKLFLDMLLKSNEIGYQILKDEISKIEIKKDAVYFDYQQKAIRKTIDKKIKHN